MTAIDPAMHAIPEDTQQAQPSTPGNYLDYAADQYQRLAEQPPMPMDVWIAATIGAGDEARANTVAVARLTIAVSQLTSAFEALLADPTAVIRAGMAAAQQQGGQFGLEETEDAQRAAEENGGPRAAADG